VTLAVLAIAGLTAWSLWRFHGLRLAAILIAFGAAVFLLPYQLFLSGQVWPAFSLLLPFGLTLVVCGAWQLARARRQFDRSEARRHHAQQQWQMAAHEIRSPLTAILGSSELLLRYPLNDAKRERMIRLISDESERLGRLVERFLSVERLSAGEMELRRAPLDLAALLASIAERMRSPAERKGIRIILDDSSTCEIEGDAELIDFAITNLLTNAVKYSPAGTSVTLSLERSEDHAQVHVADQGPGMTPEESRRVFDRFFRAKSAENSSNPGFGLGLAIAREIASHHGGELRVESSPGTGSRFTLSLPAAVPAKQPRSG
jgi:two-component system sensor histidine kinase SenX3